MKALACSPYTVSIHILVWANHGSQNMICVKVLTMLILSAALSAGVTHGVNVAIAALAALNSNNSGCAFLDLHSSMDQLAKD